MSYWQRFKNSKLIAAAEKAAEIKSLDEERKRAFLEGAAFTAEELLNAVQQSYHDDLMGASALKHVESLRLQDVRQWLNEVLSSAPPQPEREKGGS